MAIFEATIKAKLSGQDCVNVIHFEKVPAAQSDMALLAQKIKDGFIGQAIFLVASNVNWYMVEIRHIDINPWPTILVPTNQSGFTGNVPTFAPMCMVFKKKTLFQGPRNRGRIYLSGANTSSMVQGGTWGTQQLLNMQSVANSWKAQFVGANASTGFHMVIHPRDVVGNVGVDVSDIEPRAYPGTQVRRNLFRGV